MQQDAIERVHQMQRRSEQVLRRSPKAPSFFIEDSKPSKPAEEAPQPSFSAAEQPNPAPPPQHSQNMTQRPTSSYHPHQNTPPNSPLQNILPLAQQATGTLDKLLAALNLDQERLMLLVLAFLLYSDGGDQTLLLALLYLFL